ncbi:hypothetical protein [Evansella tamaricis]|nr:hypothetical protein [Evansella tamaricis]
MKVKKNSELVQVKEALWGLTWGLFMMITLFLILHFMFDIKMLQ